MRSTAAAVALCSCAQDTQVFPDLIASGLVQFVTRGANNIQKFVFSIDIVLPVSTANSSKFQKIKKLITNIFSTLLFKLNDAGCGYIT